MKNNRHNVKNEFLPVYKNLEKEVLTLAYDIHFTDVVDDKRQSQLGVYSNKIADLLVICCTQIEALFVNLYACLERGNTTETIGGKICAVNCAYGLSNKKVKIVAPSMNFFDSLGSFFTPMGYKSKDENDYYTAYCAVKHNRGNALYKANVNVLVRAMAALYILNIYYHHTSYDVDNIHDFDSSQGSDIFVVNYGAVCDVDSTGYVILIAEDLKFAEKLDQWAEKICSYETSEVLKYSEENPVPKRYHVALNKTSTEVISHE